YLQPRSQLLKVILLGDGGVGKSSLMTRYVHQRFDQRPQHTIGVEFLVKELTIDGMHFTLQIWDTAGQERYRSLRTPFYRGADACILVYALDDRRSFTNVDMWRQEFFHYSDVLESDGQKFPFLLVGNKSDVELAEVSVEDADAWANQYGMRHLTASAKSSDNVDAAFSHVAAAWLARAKAEAATAEAAAATSSTAATSTGRIRVRAGGDGGSSSGQLGGSGGKRSGFGCC
uniref:Ras-related protein Rab-9A n=2 Tax=Macrostomum lignano TaxID=282301 RepID=A0A1I8I6N5_9PLAT